MPHYNRAVSSIRRGVRIPVASRAAGVVAAIIAVAGLLALDRGAAQPPSDFASQIASLSERGGYFDTDNLISNERSYLQVLPELRRPALQGGAYIGVGPDTSFSYIAATRPRVAVIIDIRRDNLLLHLLFKALFELSATRIEYLAQLTGRPLPPAVDGWRTAPLDRIVTHLERAPLPAAALGSLRERVHASIHRTGVALSPGDFATIRRFHQRFIDEGLDLRFNSTGRAPQAHYPSYRDLLLETDASGGHGNYLGSEDAFQFVKSLQARHLIIPVVGDISGPSAMAAIAKFLTGRGSPVTVFYASNVEYYLHGQGTHARFLGNLRQLPRTRESVIIRSVFGRYLRDAPPGYGSISHTERIEEVLQRGG
jgi:hypothetical protein